MAKTLAKPKQNKNSQSTPNNKPNNKMTSKLSNKPASKTNSKVNVSEYLLAVSKDVQKPNVKSAYVKIEKLIKAFQQLEAKGQRVCVTANITSQNNPLAVSLNQEKKQSANNASAINKSASKSGKSTVSKASLTTKTKTQTSKTLKTNTVNKSASKATAVAGQRKKAVSNVGSQANIQNKKSTSK